MPEPFPKCACGCGEAVQRKGARGRAPSYASAACRKRAERQRSIERALAEAQRAEPVVLVPVSRAPVDAQVEQAILEARAIAFALTRLGTEARPELRWRCTVLGERIAAALVEVFGDEAGS